MRRKPTSYEPTPAYYKQAVKLGGALYNHVCEADPIPRGAILLGTAMLAAQVLATVWREPAISATAFEREIDIFVHVVREHAREARRAAATSHGGAE